MFDPEFFEVVDSSFNLEAAGSFNITPVFSNRRGTLVNHRGQISLLRGAPQPGSEDVIGKEGPQAFAIIKMRALRKHCDSSRLTSHM